jgi:hypothetical protein
MERRYMCDACNTKWFIPLKRQDLPDLEECPGCGGALSPYVGASARAWGQRRPSEPAASAEGSRR